MSYKRKFYERYVSFHTKGLYGDLSIEKIRSQFKFNNAYYKKFLSLKKDAAIFDMGCGNGSFVFWLHEIGFKNTIGVDISNEQINQGQKCGIKGIMCDDFRKFLKEHKNTYDIIFSRDVLEHLEKEELLDVLDEIYESLKPGGFFIAQTVNAENLLWGRLRHADFTHDLAFTKESMTQLLLTRRFKNIEIFPQRPVMHGIKSITRFFLWLCIELILHIYLFIETGTPNGIFTQNIIIRAKRS